MPIVRYTTRSVCGDTHHGEEEIQRDQRGLGGVTKRKAEALAQFRGQAERAE